MIPGRLIKRVVDATEPPLARFLERFSSTPAAIGARVEIDRLSRRAIARSEKWRSDLLHVFALPSDSDVRALARDMDRIKGSLAEIEARLEDLRP
jgi:hypothetical protein